MKTLRAQSRDSLKAALKKTTLASRQLRKALKTRPAEYKQQINSAIATLGQAVDAANAAVDFAKMSETDGPY